MGSANGARAQTASAQSSVCRERTPSCDERPSTAPAPGPTDRRLHSAYGMSGMSQDDHGLGGHRRVTYPRSVHQRESRLFLAQMAGADPTACGRHRRMSGLYPARVDRLHLLRHGRRRHVRDLDFAFAYGEHASFGRIVLIGLLALAYGAIILAIDRMLVSLPLRSIDFVPGRTVVRRRSGNGSLVRMVFALLPRFLALTIGVLVAEPLLLLAFRSEVDARVGRIATAASRGGAGCRRGALSGPHRRGERQDAEQQQLGR